MLTTEFTCQYPGYYYFVLHVFKDEGDSFAYCNIRHNGGDTIFVESNVAFDSKDSNIGTSNSVIYHLARGDVVDLGDCSPIDTFRLEDSQTSFTGFLIHADLRDITPDFA